MDNSGLFNSTSKFLDFNQERAVNFRSGNLLILAGAGSGKTRTLTDLPPKKLIQNESYLFGFDLTIMSDPDTQK